MVETLDELGQLLRTEREKKQLSVEDVADGLKISVRILRALEAGDSASLPHIVYVRGFVSAYGKYLELDVQELLTSPALYEEGEEKPRSPSFEKGTALKRKGKGGAVVIFLLCLCIGGGAGVWVYRNPDILSFFKETPVNTAEPAPALSSAQPTEPKVTSKDTVKVEQKSSADKNAADEVKKAQEAEAAKKAKEAKEAQEAAVAAKKAQEAAEKEAASQKKVVSPTPTAEDRPKHVGPHKVIITALAESWIQSAADNTVMRKFSLKPGDTFALTFDDKLSLTLGNAGGVRIHYNGKVMPTLGAKGEEKTIIFPPTP